MADKNLITQEYLLSRLSYDKESGMLTWRAKEGSGRCVPSWNSRLAGKMAGRLDSTGYVQVAIDGVRYPATHLIWMMQTGAWPKHDIDHKNRVRSDNRIYNLREASDGENSRNAVRTKNGYRGVHRAASIIEKWEARISVDRKSIYLGVHSTPEAAARRYDEAARELHGEFAVVNFK